MTGPDPDGRFVRVGHTQFRFFMPHTAPSLPEHHLANARAIEQAINAIPVTTTQTVTWDFAAMPGDGTPQAVNGTLFLAPGTHKLHQIASAASSGSDITDGTSILDPVPTIVSIGGGGGFSWLPNTLLPQSASSDITGLVRVDVATTIHVSVSVTCATTTDTVAAHGALILDPVSTT